LTPVAELRPVNIGGVTVTRATLHNERDMNKKRLRQGARVIVERSGDVIPKVVEVVHGSEGEFEPYRLPDHCPVCGSPTERDEKLVAVRCSGSFNCEAQVVEKLNHFCSRQCLDILRFGPSTIAELYKTGLVRSPVDIFTLEERNDQLEEGRRIQDWEGWGETSARNLFESIRKARRVDLPRFIFGLGINHVGAVTARLLANEFGSAEK
jgi:DNA ligase (NAD+)